MPEELPFVSVILPIRNEAACIEGVLRAVLQQDYPGEMEILTTDGMSTDGTRDIVQRSNVKLVDNPGRSCPPA
jgi:succinoglycan biosynthesis protein ExoA